MSLKPLFEASNLDESQAAFCAWAFDQHAFEIAFFDALKEAVARKIVEGDDQVRPPISLAIALDDFRLFSGHANYHRLVSLAE